MSVSVSGVSCRMRVFRHKWGIIHFNCGVEIAGSVFWHAAGSETEAAALVSRGLPHAQTSLDLMQSHLIERAIHNDLV